MTALYQCGIIWPYFYQTVSIIRGTGCISPIFCDHEKDILKRKKPKIKMGDKRQLLGHVKLLQLLRWFNCVWLGRRLLVRKNPGGFHALLQLLAIFALHAVFDSVEDVVDSRFRCKRWRCTLLEDTCLY
jgi:hypothetical protein